MNRTFFLFVVITPVVIFAGTRVTFQYRSLEANQGWATGIFAVGDIDGDGRNDIVAGGVNPRLGWIKYPEFSKRNTIGSPTQVGYEVHVADVDNDGDLDVMTSGGGIKWYENPRPQDNPATATWKEHSFGSEGTGMNGGAHDFKVGDINKDGKIDCVERDQGWNVWLVYLQQTPDSWTTFRVTASMAGEGTALGDIDGDGDLDLSDGHSWFECPANPATGTWTKRTVGNATHHLTRVVIEDINGDGRKDIVSSPTEFGGTDLIWWEAPQNPKTGTWIKHVLISYNDPNFHTLQVGDIDLNGYPDVFVGSTGGPNSIPKLLWIFYNMNGKMTDTLQQRWSSQDGCWQGILGDVGSDGDLDILTADYSGGNSQFYENMLNPAVSISHAYPTPFYQECSRLRVFLRTLLPHSFIIATREVSSGLPCFLLDGRRRMDNGWVATGLYLRSTIPNGEDK